MKAPKKIDVPPPVINASRSGAPIITLDKQDFHQSDKKTNVSEKQANVGVSTGHTLPELTTDSLKRKIYSNSVLSNDIHTGISDNSIYSSNNKVFHDSPKFPEPSIHTNHIGASVDNNRVDLPVPRRKPEVEISNEVTATADHSRQQVTDKQQSNDSKTKQGIDDHKVKEGPEVRYNQVLPREQYDRQQSDIEKKRQQVLLHRNLLKKLMKEKADKHKHKKKRKHHEKKVSTSILLRLSSSNISDYAHGSSVITTHAVIRSQCRKTKWIGICD